MAFVQTKAFTDQSSSLDVPPTVGNWLVFLCTSRGAAVSQIDSDAVAGGAIAVPDIDYTTNFGGGFVSCWVAQVTTAGEAFFQLQGDVTNLRCSVTELSGVVEAPPFVDRTGLNRSNGGNVFVQPSADITTTRVAMFAAWINGTANEPGGTPDVGFEATFSSDESQPGAAGQQGIDMDAPVGTSPVVAWQHDFPGVDGWWAATMVVINLAAEPGGEFAKPLMFARP